MTGFIIFVVVVVVIIFIVRQQKKSKEAEAIEELKSSTAYVVGVQIKDELERNGYEVDNIFTYVNEGKAIGSCSIHSKEKGSISFSNNSLGLRYIEDSLEIKNVAHKNLSDHYYAIVNHTIAILVQSNELSQTKPQFLRIAADVIKRNGYDFAENF